MTHSPAVLAAAAKRLGYSHIWKDNGRWISRWMRDDSFIGAQVIGSDADLCFALMDTMDQPVLRMVQRTWWCSNITHDRTTGAPGYTKLDAVLACVAAMEEA